MYIKILKAISNNFLDDAVFAPVSYLKNFKSLIKFIYDPENFSNALRCKQENISPISVFSSIIEQNKSTLSDPFQSSIHGFSSQSFGQYLQNIQDSQKEVTVLSSSTKEKDLEKSFSKPLNIEIISGKDDSIDNSIKISNMFETPTRRRLEKDDVMEFVKRQKQQATYNSFKGYLNTQNSDDSTGQSTNMDSESRLEALSNIVTTPSKTVNFARKRIRKSNKQYSSTLSSINFEVVRLSNVKRAVINLFDSPNPNQSNTEGSKKVSKSPSSSSNSKIRSIQSVDFSTPQSSLKYLHNIKIISNEKEIKYSTPIITKRFELNDNKTSSESKKLTEERRYKNEALSVNK